jgi:quercetin dioxygenase-like cupin family protein
MRDQGVPIHTAPGFSDIRDLELKPWDRLGCRGAFLVPDNTIDLMGMHIIELAPGAKLPPERHIYEEKYLVFSGSGTTQIWGSDPHQKVTLGWKPGSLLAIPLNAWHVVANTSDEPALLLVANSAPPVLNIFDDPDFVFGNEATFPDRYKDGDEGAFSPPSETMATPELGRAMWETNLIPDVVNCELPLDNQRSPGYRRIEPKMAGGYFWGFIGEHVPGRYAKAHAHTSGAVLVCVKGRGYTMLWPGSSGTTPWKDGRADRVERIDYGSGGLVAAAPGGGDWFHQHFGVSREPLRFVVFYGGLPGYQYAQYGLGGRKSTWMNEDIEHGGTSIAYHREDPYIRETYERELAKADVRSRMDQALYEGGTQDAGH